MELNREQQITLVIVTHNEELSRRSSTAPCACRTVGCAERTTAQAVMRAGRVYSPEGVVLEGVASTFGDAAKGMACAAGSCCHAGGCGARRCQGSAPHWTCAAAGPRLDRVAITGNQRVEEEAIRVQLRAQPGSALEREIVDSDIRVALQHGLLSERRRPTSTQQNGQWVLTYRVTERPLMQGREDRGQQEDRQGGARGGAARSGPTPSSIRRRCAAASRRPRSCTRRRATSTPIIDYRPTRSASTRSC